MKKVLGLLLFIIFLPGCFITIVPSLVPPPPKEAVRRSSYASDYPKPAWVNRTSYWEEKEFMYAVGVIPESEGYDFSIRLRISEMEGKKQLLLANNICHGIIVGGIPLQTWVSADGTIHTLVRGERIIPREKCKP
ncbi:hypothetical protein HY839_02240 [Candidatus Azambacteria bacterium]|nr:hypothetical protein [Candidatus Azambacteria bacterium]